MTALPALFNSLWNYREQRQKVVPNMEHMSDVQAREYIPQTPRAEALYETAVKSHHKTPYEAMRITNLIIFDGGYDGETKESDTKAWKQG